MSESSVPESSTGRPTTTTTSSRPTTTTPSPMTTEPTGAADGTTPSTTTPDSSGPSGAIPPEDGAYECNICLDTAKDAVVSLCGHLFCWPCLHQWLETRPTRQVCPVCKAGISKDKVIPIYGRGNTGKQDPREKLPPRPAGQRPEPETQGPFNGFGFGDGNFQMSFGIGAFPFGLFATAFNFGDGRFARHGQGVQAQNPEEQFLGKVFLWVALLFMIWLIIA